MTSKTVAIVLYADVLMLDVAGPIEVFSIANRYLPESDHYRILTLGADSLGVRASNGIGMQADQLAVDAPVAYDTLLVPGGPGAYNDRHPHLYGWLRDAAQASRRYGAVCTGAFILGEAGLLDGHRVTTHWHYLDRLGKRYPKAQLESDQLFTKDGKLLSSGGVTAGIDLALSILADDHGKKLALDVAKVLLVVIKRQGGQAQFSPLLPPTGQGATPLDRVQQYVLENIQEPFTVEQLAELAAMSVRNFARVFTRELQMTPMEFVLNARVDHARALLESTDLPLKTVAFRSGFGSTRHMRQLFDKCLGLTPVQYRHQFG
ncbi:GlxA family transcriptional regulator [Pseudomonas argentinensis]|uniref:GlxA family transcriptional regulator n=1 Tax=Phytopseudomonas argentinensis TaxID=289370 RepID=UPI0008A8E52A|nr:GlxA family transcriptional regulator [Pseudomonas argentinensis]